MCQIRADRAKMKPRTGKGLYANRARTSVHSLSGHHQRIPGCVRNRVWRRATNHGCDRLADDGDKAAARVVSMVETPANFLATIQIGITIASFFAAAVGAVTFTSVIEDTVAQIPIGFIENNASAVSFALITIGLSFFSIVFGELIPKTLAVHRADSVRAQGRSADRFPLEDHASDRSPC